MNKDISFTIKNFITLEGIKSKRAFELYYQEIIEDFLTYLSTIQDPVKFSEVSKKDIENYLNEALANKEEIISQYFLNRERIIEAFCDHLVRSGLLVKNPCNELKN